MPSLELCSLGCLGGLVIALGSSSLSHEFLTLLPARTRAGGELLGLVGITACTLVASGLALSLAGAPWAPGAPWVGIHLAVVGWLALQLPAPPTLQAAVLGLIAWIAPSILGGSPLAAAFDPTHQPSVSSSLALGGLLCLILALPKAVAS